MKIDGQCRCGSISFEAEIDPDWVSSVTVLNSMRLPQGLHQDRRKWSQTASALLTLDRPASAHRMATAIPDLYPDFVTFGSARRASFSTWSHRPIRFV
jgi:hypothetical protein